jgi:hypothetical protein
MDLTKLMHTAAFDESSDIGFEDIRTWAAHDSGGGLPDVAALPFAAWLDAVWSDYDDGEGTQTNDDVLKGALAYWTGSA